MRARAADVVVVVARLRKRGVRFAVAAAAIVMTAFAVPSAEAIVGGDAVAPGQRSFTAALLEGSGQFCGGSVVAVDLVVTAAHCVADRSADVVTVAVGATDYTVGTPVPVAEIHVHPGYADDITLDVAVLRLAHPVPAGVDHLTLATAADEHLEAPGTPVVVTGWGSRTPILGEAPAPDTALHEVELHVVADDDVACTTPDLVSPSDPYHEVCAADLLESVCHGDSGSPLFADLPHGPVQIGIAVWSLGCGLPASANHFTELNSPPIAAFLSPFLEPPEQS